MSKGETTIQQAPTTPAPSASETAEDIYQARMKYDPMIAQQEMELQNKFLPQQTALYSSLYNQYYPTMARQQQSLQQELYPYQSQIVEQGAQSALNTLRNPETDLLKSLTQQAQTGLQNPETALMQALSQQAMAGLTSPTGYTTEQQSAIDAIRQRQASGLSKQLRERSNLGGTLYGGRSQQLESQGLQELAQKYSAEDVDRIIAQRQNALLNAGNVAAQQLQARQNALATASGVAGQQLQSRQQSQSALSPYMQILYPSVGTQSPNISAYQYQSAVPSADTLYNAMYQASQPQNFAIKDKSGISLGPFGQWGYV